MATYVLVHGAWHGGWCWQKIMPLLAAQGHTVVAPDLPGHGADKTEVSTVTLKHYVERILETARAQKEPVILAGHSMGGVAITQAAENSPEHFRALVYVCAFLPRNGDSLSTWAMRDHESMVNPATMHLRPDGTIEFDKQHAREAFYGNCADADALFAQSRLLPQAGAPLATPVQTTPESWGRIPRYYVECARDRAITRKLQREMHNALPCQQVFSIDTDHSPFLSAPRELAQIFEHVI